MIYDGVRLPATTECAKHCSQLLLSFLLMLRPMLYDCMVATAAVQKSPLIELSNRHQFLCDFSWQPAV